MNERIKELAEQALPNIKYWDEEFIPGTPGITPPDTRATNLNELEKFAELIIKECGVALSPMLRDMVSRGQAYDLIKQHFGVE